jgi:hypothetical protein
MDGDAGAATKPQDSGTAALGSINLPNLIMADLLELIKLVSMIDTQLKNNKLEAEAVNAFFSHFQSLFMMSEEVIGFGNDEAIPKLRAYFSRPFNLSDLKDQRVAAQEGINLALVLKAELVEAGMWRIFSPPIQPPFMRDRL